MSLYEKIGGQTAIAQVVDEFYARILADPTVNHFFANTDMEQQRQHQTAFISYALGGAEYTGRSMELAHAGLNLQPAHFAAIATHLGDALAAKGVPLEDINTILTKVATLQDAVLHK